MCFSEMSQTREWIAMNFCTHIHGAQRTNPDDFGDLRIPLKPVVLEGKFLFVQENISISAWLKILYTFLIQDQLWWSPVFLLGTIMRSAFIYFQYFGL